MATEDLTREYRRGAISRRAFVQGMVALGMTVTAANLMADRAEAASNHHKVAVDDVYGGTPSRRTLHNLHRARPRRQHVKHLHAHSTQKKTRGH